MTIGSGHMKDSRLFASYIDERAGEAVDPRVADHLATCASCAGRFQEMAAMMNELRDSADAELDAVYSPARLEEQRQQILRRLEHVNRAARVISFPAREVSGDARPAALMTPRWVAAAAAAGLFIGFAVGGYVGPERLRLGHTSSYNTQSAPPAMSVQRTSSSPAVRVGATQPEPDDDAFLADLEVALERPHARALLPFDAMTPHVRDIENRGR